MSDRGEVSSQRQAKLSLLRRQRSGEPARARLEQIFEAVPNDTWRLLSLPESDALTPQMFSAVSVTRQRGQLAAQLELSRAAFGSEFHRLLMSQPQQELALVALSDVEEIGLVESRLFVLATLGSQILDFDRDSLIATSADMSWGIVAQRFEHEHDDAEYQIESWGL